MIIDDADHPAVEGGLYVTRLTLAALSAQKRRPSALLKARPVHTPDKLNDAPSAEDPRAQCCDAA